MSYAWFLSTWDSSDVRDSPMGLRPRRCHDASRSQYQPCRIVLPHCDDDPVCQHEFRRTILQCRPHCTGNPTVRTCRLRLGDRGQSWSRNDSSSCLRSLVVFGYAILSPPSASRTICETMSRALSLSSAGTTYQGAWSVLVAFRHFS